MKKGILVLHRTKLIVGIMLAFLISMLGIAFASAVLTYPSLPPGTYDIVYDTEPEADWGPTLSGANPTHLRVRFTPEGSGQLVREARIAWNGPWNGDDTFKIHLVDADTGLTKTTPVITEPDPGRGWKVYDVSSLAFFTSGDFYIEFWSTGAEFGVFTDDTSPVYGRSERNSGDGWYYDPLDPPSDWKIRAVVSRGPVGGIAVPVDKLGLLAPYIALAVALVAVIGGTVYVRKRWFGKAVVQTP